MSPWALLLVLAAATTQRAWPSHAPTSVRQTPRPVAVVNGVTLLSDRLEAAVSTLLPLESFHQNVSPDKVAALRQQALAQIVDEELQYQDGMMRGVKVSDAEVERALADTVARYPSRKAFTDALAQSGASLIDMRRELRRRATIRKAYEQRVSARCSVSRDEAQRFFDEHPERFIEPERLHIHAITIGVDPTSGGAAWTSARARAEDVRQQLSRGAAFDDLARQYATESSASKDGDMGLLHRGSLAPAFEAATATLAPGEISGVVESIYGYHILRVTEILPPRPRSFTDVGARLAQDLSAERCGQAKDAWIAELRRSATITYPR